MEKKTARKRFGLCFIITTSLFIKYQVITKYDNCLGDGLTAYRKHNSCETTYWLGGGFETG